jgi:nucleotide-binding universal stress UspA family protein
MFDSVLIPTDGSDPAGRAVRAGIDLAGLVGATVHGLYVVDARDYGRLPDGKWVEVQEELATAGERALEDLRAAAEAADLPVETTVETGVPHEAILAYVADHGVDLVVMGTHGRTGLDRALLGSVTEKVLRGTEVPVHVVHGRGED